MINLYTRDKVQGRDWEAAYRLAQAATEHNGCTRSESDMLIAGFLAGIQYVRDKIEPGNAPFLANRSK